MSLNFLQIHPEEAIVEIDDLIHSGNRHKDAALAGIPLGGQIDDWHSNAERVLRRIFTSSVEVDDFHWATQHDPRNGFNYDNPILNALLPLDASIRKLMEFRKFIFRYYGAQIKFTFESGRDLIIQNGEGNTAHVEN